MATAQAARRTLIGLIAVAAALVAWIALPFSDALFLAAVLAGALEPLERRLTRRLGGRRALVSALLCFGVLFVLVVPIAALVAFIVVQVVAGVDVVTDILRSEGLQGLVGRLPSLLRAPAERFVERLETEGRGLAEVLADQLGAHGASAAEAMTGVLGMLGSLAFQLAMMLIALFFLLFDGWRLVRWVEGVTPLAAGQTLEILREFRSVTFAVLVSSIATAGVQTLAALVGYLIARVPVPFFFAALTFVLALIPAIGATVVCLAAALLLLATGHPWAALFLALWGILVVGISDNLVKPLLVKRGLHLHGAIVFFALLGGLAVFGPTGLLLGPLAVAFFLSLIRIYERDYGRSAPPPEPPGAPLASKDRHGAIGEKEKEKE